ncbi:hypothetical protein [Streptomyces sp. NRRL WC-3626]|uniref:hypothetical protein n=1 Tax=Streptomyces sp. NRRL WC-3626 TaxID=1463926 RepID=UPI000AFEA09D|nr:hypothetical protein [Streptomyces sp. NRRL WC-3626]
MQWTDTTEALAAVVASGAAVVGLAVVIVKLRHLAEGMKSAARRATYDIGVQIKLVLIEHPQLRPFFFDDVPAPHDHPDRSRIASLTELYCIYFQELVEQSHHLTPGNRAAWRALVRSMYRSSPSIRGQLEPALFLVFGRVAGHRPDSPERMSQAGPYSIR